DSPVPTWFYSRRVVYGCEQPEAGPSHRARLSANRAVSPSGPRGRGHGYYASGDPHSCRSVWRRNGGRRNGESTPRQAVGGGGVDREPHGRHNHDAARRGEGGGERQRAWHSRRANSAYRPSPTAGTARQPIRP